eukprot:CAMPEP_0204513174 /NCGR_PEP_ID=MMETSP0661-20131031/1360_1 /ASSEMBLY_ACC=CAM_ASM_000606 /TAXON_ID=109239 /ORGANISM="Alexandrium margalefi, Strain AMGDE01CS-322" /LENGTH=334 /DNA_ID=CAMNT_0051518327 /DNA_START=19 /DNA_END=1020 /DNA_ORIENTATION=-
MQTSRQARTRERACMHASLRSASGRRLHEQVLPDPPHRLDRGLHVVHRPVAVVGVPRLVLLPLLHLGGKPPGGRTDEGAHVDDLVAEKPVHPRHLQLEDLPVALDGVAGDRASLLRAVLAQELQQLALRLLQGRGGLGDGREEPVALVARPRRELSTLLRVPKGLLVEVLQAVQLRLREAADHPAAPAKLLQVLVGDHHGNLQNPAVLILVVASRELQVEKDDVLVGSDKGLVLLVARIAVAVLQRPVHPQLDEGLDHARLPVEHCQVQGRALVGGPGHIEVEAELGHGLDRGAEAPAHGQVDGPVLVLVTGVAPVLHRLQTVALHGTLQSLDE